MRATLHHVRIITSLIGILTVPQLSGQGSIGPGKESLVPPVDIPIFLAGNFAEPRANHFHSGIDIKTNGVTGIPVHAVTAGTVSRIKVEPGGYGRALYIRHADGYTSVYAHLQEFSQAIEKYVRDEQYRRESFSVDLFPEPGKFPVRQGEIVALSGNSGGSEGPHLHFELRETTSENTINPLVRSLPVQDNNKPVISRIYAFSLTGRQEWIQPVSNQLSLSDGLYKPSSNTPLPLDNICGLGIETWDLLDGSSNKCGIYRIQALLDGELFYEFVADEFAFAETRYMNSFMDYRLFMKNHRPVLRLYIEPNNQLSLFRFSRNHGRIELQDQKVHSVRLIVEDAAGNCSEALVPVKLNPSQFKRDPDFIPVYDAYFSYEETNVFSSEGIDIRLPQGALYDDIYFQYEVGEPQPGCYSLTHSIHRPDVPLHLYYRLSIEAVNLPPGLKDKAIIAQQEENNQYSPVGGTWEGSHLVTRTRSFGIFCICVDTLKPEIRPLNFKNPEDLRKASSIKLAVKDDFSGIVQYRGEVDGKWVLMEFDPKNNLLEYKIDPERIGTGKQHKFELLVSDQLKNTTTYCTTFYR
jgi:hypothetical protein